METVTNLASNIATTASKAIWGDQTATAKNETSGREPIAGEMGDVKAGEPFDKGNLDSTTTDLTTPPTTAITLPKTSVTVSDNPTSTNNTSSLGVAPSNADPVTTTPSTLDHEGTSKPTQSLSGVESKLTTEPKLEAEKATEIPASTVGAKSLDVGVGSGSAIKIAGIDDGPQTESQGETTGTKYVKSSGLVADGGNFDASNPGAGKDADRLLKEKNVQHTPAVAPATAVSTSDDENSSPGKEGKLSHLKEKIKAKLHKH